MDRGVFPFGWARAAAPPAPCGVVRQAKPGVRHREHRHGNSDPHDPVPDQRALQPNEERALLRWRPGHRELAQRGEAKGIQQRRQLPPPQRPGHEGPAEDTRREEQHTTEIAHDRAPVERRQRKHDRGCDERVRQQEDQVGSQIRVPTKWTEQIRVRTRHDRCEQQSERHGDKNQREKAEGCQKSATEVLGLADRRRVEERSDPRLHVSRSGITGHRACDEQAHHAAEKRHRRDDERPVEQVALVARVVDIDFPGHVIREHEQERGTDPRRGAARLMADFEAEDLPELHRPACAEAAPGAPCSVLPGSS